MYIVVEQVIRPLTVKPQRELEFCKSISFFPGKSVPARTSCCASPVCQLFFGALFSNESAPAFRMLLQKQLICIIHFSVFLNPTGVPILAMFLA